MIEQLIKKNNLNPKKLFQIDGFGALISAFLLGVILVKYEVIFGIPSSTLYFLAILPIFFFFYDIYSYQKNITTQKKLLKGISIINISYCFLSLGLTLYHYKTITIFGWIYVIIEILIVLFIAYIEYKVAQKIN